ncbi:hypothetical protein GGI15_004021 [Coemansia interrupta]|uniref:Uncharacterized protein n=1 Tax=Coemansia interrupta TaxID=1126814 RepID=A0A9W8HC36_9FUNG|nr:hypothetical protein GGI15_004021 [Coemansia interrupta]
MSSYLADELAKLGVDDQAIIDYCVGLPKDDTRSLSDKAEMVVSYFDPLTDSATIECNKLIAAYEYCSAEIVERADSKAELVDLHDDGDKAADAGLQHNRNAQVVAEK